MSIETINSEYICTHHNVKISFWVVRILRNKCFKHGQLEENRTKSRFDSKKYGKEKLPTEKSQTGK